jgi:protein ImuB
MYTCLLLPNFRLQAALRWREWRGSAVVVDESSSKALILETNAAAKVHHIHPGMTATQAMAHDKRVLILPSAPEQEECLHQLLIERALSLAPEVEISPEGFCLANMQNVPATLCWQQMADQQIAAFEDDGLRLQVGVAVTPDLAILAAKGASTRPAIVYDAPAYVAPLPIIALEPSPALQQILTDWGIHTIGAFLALPASEVTERLGPEAQELRRKVSGQHKRPLQIVRTPPAYTEAFDFDYEVETTEPLLFLLRRFLESLCPRLQSVYRVAQTLRLSIPLDDKTRHERTFSIPAPTAEIDVLFRVLATYLETLQLAQRPVGLRLRIDPALPARDQLSLFESALRDPNQFGETLARLKALFGNEAIGVPVVNDSHRPDDFHLAENFPPTQTTPPLPLYGLPLRRYRPAAQGSVQLVAGRPAQIDSSIISGPIRQCAGPYVLSGHWWDREQWQTEEWDVELEGGLYRLSRHNQRWLVEGCYEVC